MTLLDQVAAAFSTKRGMALLLLGAALFLFLPGQARIPPLDRDEPRFAQSTRQMLESGDFVQIRFQDDARNLQPAGIYWLQAASVTLLGDKAQREIWPHRVPSWLSAIGVAFLTWWVAALLFGATAGRMAGLLVGSSFLLGVEAHIAKIDATLCFVTLIAQASLAKIYMSRAERTHVGWSALLWGALGAGVLLKGPIVLLVTGGTILGLVLLERRIRWLGRLNPLWGVPLMLLIAAPWYVAIGIATDGEFFHKALGYSLVGKITQTHQAHGGPFGYHLALWPLLLWPGSLFAALAAPFVWRERKSDPVRFCIAWIAPAWLVFEFSGTKLPHYTLPLFPAIAALAGAALANVGAQRFLGRPWLLAIATPIWLVCGFVVAVAFLYVQMRYEGRIESLAIGLAGAAIVCMLGVIAFAVLGRPRAALAAAVLSAAIAAFNNFEIVAPRLDNVFTAPRLAAALDAARPCPTTRVVSFAYREPSFVFLSGGAPIYPGDPETAATLAAADPVCNLVLLSDRDDAFKAALARRGFAAEPISTVRGYNHNEGEDIAMTLHRLVSATPSNAP
ncbi:MAG TPA: glycosyltransferase family 39 protein [Verrucomicrobiae bacterium]|nr:glycosyltransferase family 39 protein [Verrucomicrobiae bacterium]